MKKISIKNILQIYIHQGLTVLIEYLDRIEYEPTDKYAKIIMDNKKNSDVVESEIKKILKQ